MNSDFIEEAISAFLERREMDPSLTPAQFVSEYLRGQKPDDPPGSESEDVGASATPISLESRRLALEAELLRAIHAAIEVDRLLPGGSPMPESIGPYRVVREIGRGGMAIVYEVVRSDPSSSGDDTRLALKLHPLSPLWSARSAERSRREIAALAGISHDHIVRIRDWGEEDGAPYFVMDLVEGSRLDETSVLSRDDSVRIVGVLARAVHEAHARGVIHRDLKPQNVILRSDGSPVLVDFGLSAAEDLPSLTMTDELIGTPRYMAPEQVREGKADARTDVYALGLILYELLTRRPARVSKSREGLLHEVWIGAPEAPRKIDPTIPAALERVVLQALAFDSEDRYQSAAALADDLERFRRGERVVARPPLSAAAKSRRIYWRRRLIVGAVSLLIAAAAWKGIEARNALYQQRRAEASVHATLAFSRHLEGDSAAAVAELESAASLDPSAPGAIALSAHLSKGEVPANASSSARELRESLRDYADRDYAGAERHLAAARDLDPALRSMLAGVYAEEKGSLEEAERELMDAQRVFPTSTFILRRLASVYRQQGAFRRAHDALVQAIEVDSASASLWTERAAVELARRDLEGGLRSVAIARRLGDSTNVTLLLTEAALRANAQQGEQARDVVRRVLDSNPDNGEAWYQLGFAHDIDHQAIEARDAYMRATLLSSDDARPWFCLANIYSGASRGQCGSCDLVYRTHPELLDFDLAEAALLRTLEIDRGRQDWIMKSALDISMRLERRDPIIAMVDRLIAADPSSSSGLRLAELARRLRLTAR